MSDLSPTPSVESTAADQNPTVVPALDKADAPVSVDELLSEAKAIVAEGEALHGQSQAIETESFHRMRQAAEKIEAARKLGAGQRRIADAMGKSVGWVNGLLKWRREGYRGTPFGPGAKASRQRAAHVQSPEQRKTRTADRLEAEKERARADAAKAKADARAARARADAECFEFFAERLGGDRTDIKLDSHTRDLLVKSLGMLGSDQPGERDNAALAAEKLRHEVRLTWDELIIPAAELSS